MLIKNALIKINWEASSVILAMLLFIGNIMYTHYYDEIKLKSEKEKIRTMFAYEISNNHHLLNLLNETRNIGFDENMEYVVGEPFAINLKSLGGVRLTIASNQGNKVFKTYFSELSKLDKEDVTLVMDYYHEQGLLMKRIKAVQINMENSNSVDLDIEGLLLESHFLNELNLSNIILKRYNHLLAQHTKEPEMENTYH
ncbi:lysogenic conversion protein [Salmonella enterica]|uniref:Lysogenic conversion protein n=1 Tax=Salmonella enterica TaxID=28901 RepID=A0A5U4CT93_SALER|nr:lysogenic conversion protein [Salmonella enterica]EEN6707927.1 lysogenic conversion protein [Salmonella enterica subsp. enterica serovar Rubislaw]